MSGSMQTGSGTPIVTEGAAGSRQPYGDFFSAYERMQQLRQPQSSGGFFDFSPAQQSALDRLGALGAAMASTRSPTFAGALGEGLQAMQRTAAGQRQEERQNRQLDVEAAYRAAQEARQMAEFEYARDPTNPLYQLRVAQTRQAEAQAQAALMNARTSASRERLGTGVPGRVGEREGMWYPQAGRFIEAPENFVGSSNAADRLRQGAIRAAIQAGQNAATRALQAARTSGNIVNQNELMEIQRREFRAAARAAGASLGLDSETLNRIAESDQFGEGGGGNAPRGPNPVIDSTTGRPIAP